MAEQEPQPERKANGAVAASPRAGGFPLASLALLVTVFAIALACADLDRWREQYAALTATSHRPLVALFVVSGVAGALVGLAHPLIHGFTWRRFMIAPTSGILAGWIGAFLLAASGPIWRTIFAIGVLLLSAALFRLNAD